MKARLALAALALLIGAAAPAAAHVDVLPREVAQGEAVEFTVRVPTERALPTTRVQVQIPPQVTVFSFSEPPAGWSIHTARGADKQFRSVIYSGGASGVERYVDFHFLGTPFASGTAIWKTRQTYADGQVKPWTGPPETNDAPASGEGGPTDPGPAAAVTIGEPGQAIGAAAATTDDSGAAIWLGVIAIAISAMSLLALGFLWSTRPARLPGGDAGP